MKTLQDLIDQTPDLVDHLYNDTISQYHKSRTGLLATLIAPEYTTWREEQRAWRETAVLFNQSHHMPVLFVKGRDARKLLEYLSPCTFSNLSTDRAKQYFCVTPRGHHVGDCVLNYYGEAEGFELISGMPVLNWVRFHGETGGYDVQMRFDPSTPYARDGQREKFRFQLEGPNARDILDEICEGGWPEIRFFHTAYVTIAGCRVHVLRHGMAGHAGAELSGPFAELDRVRDAIIAAGEKRGLRQAGTRTYYSTPLEDGWIPYPLPGIYTGDELRAYREWLPADSWEANMQLGGSLYSRDIEDYYWTPSALGYEKFVKFDHDFIGRAALEAQMQAPRRVKRVLRWHHDDVARIFASQTGDGPIYKAIDMPTSYYGWPQADELRSADGALIGMSQYCGYNINEREFLSLACVDEAFAEPGTEVVLTWGEVSGGSRKPHVERHDQTTIRATVHLAPFSKEAQEKLRAVI
ncbi:glycine cleavage system protein T [Gemmobacter nanjingensis]|uniref:Glycine cleavage system protein T n=1 Tax=Gemmobacter nanjingensis TaxID=488454 RepID=A0ABQ3FTE5_9RHOB|nr:aminomethyl transferase family protein [Gemmobacter nanjingensis]GHC40532.1 glycine cleavage system protein T [Gemmobacter nanjingensis]